MIAVNVSSVFRAIRAVLPGMIARGSGDIVVTSSISGHAALHWEPVYSGTKHAIQSFVHGLRRQVAPHGIRVGEVSPGIVLNELWGYRDPDVIRAKVEAHEGLLTEDVADAVRFMLTRPRARHDPRRRHPAAEPGHLSPTPGDRPIANVRRSSHLGRRKHTYREEKECADCSHRLRP